MCIYLCLYLHFDHLTFSFWDNKVDYDFLIGGPLDIFAKYEKLQKSNSNFFLLLQKFFFHPDQNIILWKTKEYNSQPIVSIM